MIDEKKILTETIVQHGVVTQHSVAMEECSELIKEISKANRGYMNRAEMIEEMADVTIVIKELMLMHQITDKELQDAINFKLVRLNARNHGTD